MYMSQLGFWCMNYAQLVSDPGLCLHFKKASYPYLISFESKQDSNIENDICLEKLSHYNFRAFRRTFMKQVDVDIRYFSYQICFQDLLLSKSEILMSFQTISDDERLIAHF